MLLILIYNLFLLYSLRLINMRSYNYNCTSSWWWVSTPETCRAAYKNVINWIIRILLDSYEIRFTMHGTMYIKKVVVSNILAKILIKLLMKHLRFPQRPDVSEWTQCVASCLVLLTADWIKVAQQWAALNAVTRLLATRNMGNCLTSWGSGTFWRRNLLRAVLLVSLYT
jgi:hypothetical protein